MFKLLKMSRELGFTNEPEKLYRQYKNCGDKQSYDLITSYTDSQIERIIYDFFKPERFLKRLNLYF